MLNIPQEYQLNHPLTTKAILPKQLSRQQSRRFQKAVQSAILTDQIVGEQIPSYIAERYNVQVIMFLSIRLNSIRDATFVANILQSSLKPFCVISLTDGVQQRLSFAKKRTSMKNPDEMVLEQAFLSQPFVTPDSRLDFANVKNRTNKLNFYSEWMLRAFLLSGPTIYADFADLLDADFWYNPTEVEKVSEQLQRLKTLRAELPKAELAKERVRINTEITEIRKQLQSFAKP